MRGVFNAGRVAFLLLCHKQHAKHQQVRGVEDVEKPFIEIAPVCSALPIIKAKDHEPRNKDGHAAAEGVPPKAAAHPRHAAVQRGGDQKRGLLARAGILRPREQQREHGGKQRPVAKKRRTDEQNNAGTAQHTILHFFLHIFLHIFLIIAKYNRP